MSNVSNQTAAAETVLVFINPTSDFAVTVGNSLVFPLLWLKQRGIYVHPSLKVLTNKYASVFSSVVLTL